MTILSSQPLRKQGTTLKGRKGEFCPFRNKRDKILKLFFNTLKHCDNYTYSNMLTLIFKKSILRAYYVDDVRILRINRRFPVLLVDGCL